VRYLTTIEKAEKVTEKQRAAVIIIVKYIFYARYLQQLRNEIVMLAAPG
jgi:hypothetical protein